MDSALLHQPDRAAPAAPTAEPVHRVGLNPAARLTSAQGTDFTVTLGTASAEAERVPAWMVGQLSRLADDQIPEEELQAAALTSGGPAGLFRWVENLRRLDAAGMLVRSVWVAGEKVCALLALGAGPTIRPAAFDPASRQRLSRLVMVRMLDGNAGGRLVAQHPDSHLAVELGAAAVGTLGHLADWTDWAEITKRLNGPGGPAVRAVLGHFARAGLLEQRSDSSGIVTAAAAPHPEGTGAHWNPLDWWLHARTRNPRSVNGWGGSYPGRGRFAQLPAQPEPYGGRLVDLTVPALRGPDARSAPLTAVLETRRSIREHDDARPITADQLSELLFRVGRVRSSRRTSGSNGTAPDDILDKPYPSGGALHELELYAAVRSCTGLEPGFYHYQSVRHRLERVRGAGPAVDQLLWAAQSAATMARPPQVLLVISARFARLMYKYDTIAYALLLKHVGVLQQTLYLVATDMRLAPTALGSGDAGAFAEATGRDPMTEGSVGEFVIGALPAGRPAPLDTWAG